MLTNRRPPSHLVRFFAIVAALAATWYGASAIAAPTYVIEISIDGLGSSYLQNLLNTPSQVSSFNKLVTEGAYTFNARNDWNITETLQNHTSMVTGRGVWEGNTTTSTTGHGWTVNGEVSGQNLHTNPATGNRYIASVFDVVHDNGGRTGMYATKDKFNLFNYSYDGTNGAVDTIGPDNGRDKIDNFMAVGNSSTILTGFLSDMSANPMKYSFVHFSEPDWVGHASGWGSTEYMNAVRTVDGYLGQIFNLVNTDSRFMNKTAIILTADHGGTGTGHGDPTLALDYTIPFMVWGGGATAGAELYALNSATRQDPGASRPLYSGTQPIRNSDGANLALDLLGYGPIPGSTMNFAQNLEVTSSGIIAQPGTIGLTHATYSQNFDSMGSAGTAAPTNWKAGNFSTSQNGLAAPGSTPNNVTLGVDNGSNNGGATDFAGNSVNYGATGGTDRALGNYGNTAGGDRGIQVGFTNLNTAPIAYVRVKYANELWRANAAPAAGGTEPALFYSTAPGTGFVAMGSQFNGITPTLATQGAVNGDIAPYHTTVGGVYQVPAPVATSGTFYLTWFDMNNSGTDNGMAIDDVTVKAYSALPVTIAQTAFAEPAVGATSYSGGTELGFTTTSTAQGTGTAVGVTSSRDFGMMSALATTTFTQVSLASYDEVSFAMDIKVGNTGYEDGDYFQAVLSNGVDSINLVNWQGATALNSLVTLGYKNYEVDIPDSWNQATLTISSSTNSSSAAEFFNFDNLQFIGVMGVPPKSLTWNTTNGDWNTTSTNKPWTESAAPASFATNDSVTFNQAAGGTVTVDAAGVAPAATTVSAASGTYTFAGGPISGPLTKSGAGTMVLQAPNSFSSVSITGGTVETQVVGALGSGPVNLDGAKWKASATQAPTNALTIGSNGGTIEVTPASSMTLGDTGNRHQRHWLADQDWRRRFDDQHGFYLRRGHQYRAGNS